MIKKLLQLSIGIIVAALLLVTILPLVFGPYRGAATGKVDGPDARRSSPTFTLTPGGMSTGTAITTATTMPTVLNTAPASTPTVSAGSPGATPTVALHTGKAVVSTSIPFGVGSSMWITGENFSPGEPVALYWDYQQPGQFEMTTVIAGTAWGPGGFQFQTNAPSDPDVGKVQVAAIGTISHLLAVTSVTVPPQLLPVPWDASAGQKIQLSGGGFGSDEQITLLIEGILVGKATTDYRGEFATSFIVPASASPGSGSNILEAIGQTSGLKVYAYFFGVYHFYPVAISPTSGPAGTSVTITGSTFTPGGLLTIEWYTGGRYVYTSVTTLTASSAGTFTVTVTAPQCPYIPGGANPCAFFVYDNQTQASSSNIPFPES